MRLDAVTAQHRGGGYPGVIERPGVDWLLAGIIDGTGCWGAGLEAADWSRRRLIQRWANLDLPSSLQIVEDIQAVAAALPAEFRESEFGCAFSVALALVQGRECHVIAAGAYGVRMVGPTESRALFTPRRWVDLPVEAGLLTAEAAPSHPLHRVMAGPFVADEQASVPVTCGPFSIPTGWSTLIAEQRVLDRLGGLPAERAEPLTAAAVQRLVDPPVTPVVVIHG